MSSPLVTAVVPVHNGERFLCAALDSILGQAYAPVEVVVVDDGSTDGSESGARSRPVRYVGQPNRGVAAARNAGLAAARGSLVAFLDQDDEWEPDKLTRQVEYLADHPEVGFVLAHLRLILEPGTPCPSWLREESIGERTVGYCPGTMVARRETFERIGGFDEVYEVASDAEWITRARDAGVGMHMLPEALLRYRIHDANASHRVDAVRAEVLRVLRDSIERRRGGLPTDGSAARG